jgi:hypothetical protein
LEAVGVCETVEDHAERTLYKQLRQRPASIAWLGVREELFPSPIDVTAMQYGDLVAFNATQKQVTIAQHRTRDPDH